MEQVSLLIIGGGPAGMSAALGAWEAGVRDILLTERGSALGGVLPQCIHNGFGLYELGRDLTGPEYARLLEDRLSATGVQVRTDTAVFDLAPDGRARLCGPQGVEEVQAACIILATGCRERPIGALPVTGTRPAGVYTAGVAQQLINLDGYEVGRRVVILGSGDIGLILARRLVLTGSQVLCVVEQADTCGGLLRNRVQCLEEWNIPLYTGATVARVFGEERVTGVEVAWRDGRRTRLDCDTLVTAVGLVPETDLCRGWDAPWLFRCGNAAYVHSLVDQVSQEGRETGMAAAEYLRTGVRRTVQVRPDTRVPQGTLGGNQLVCLSCPKGCVLTVEGDGAVTGGACPKGEAFARQELQAPVRLLTATVACGTGRQPVRSDVPIPLSDFASVLAALAGVCLSQPVPAGGAVLDRPSGVACRIVATGLPVI